MRTPTARAEQWAAGTERLAALLGISKGAVSKWGEFMPTLRVFQLRTLRPEWFDDDGNLKAPS